MVVPALDESPRIGRVLRTMPAEVDRVVVVDDGSRDATAEVARASGDPRVEVVRHPARRGVGAAIVTGYERALEEAGGPRDAFVVMAGDGQMDGRDLPALVAPLARGETGYVKGNRFAWHGRTPMPLPRRVGGAVFSRLTSAALGMAIHDSQCGYTALARWAAARLDLAALWRGYGYPNDLLSLVTCAGVAVAEVPVRPVYAGEPSKLHPRHLPRIGWIVARAYVRRLQTRQKSAAAPAPPPPEMPAGGPDRAPPGAALS